MLNKFTQLCIVFIMTNIVGIGHSLDINEAQKKAQKLKLSSEYKAKSGFSGDIEFWDHNMQFRLLDGKYPNISVPKSMDTLAAYNYAENILSGLSDYMDINRDQIKLYYNSGLLLKYRQEINGIGFENDGILVIRFNAKNGNVIIANGLLPVTDLSSQIRIAKQKAIDLMLPIEKENNLERDSYLATGKNAAPYTQLFYRNLGTHESPDIRLCWVIVYLSYRVDIDAITGEIIQHMPDTINDMSLN